MDTNCTSLPIGITMGCPAGIGPEIILKYFNSRPRSDHPPSVVIGDMSVLLETGRHLDIPAPAHSWLPGNTIVKERINVLDLQTSSPGTVVPGQPNKTTGAAMMSYLERAVTLCSDRMLAGITTCPISKETMNEAGYNFPGHTEFLAQRTQSNNVIMMMAGQRLKITLATIHCALASVPSMLTTQKLKILIGLTQSALQVDFGIRSPKIAVAGLNPHGGEHGLFGTEEQEVIAPAIEQMRKDHAIDVSGPFPPDTVFYKAASGDFDVVICMYHDQGLIPFKMIHFTDGVNITLGLPLVRTSVDHGTAYDIAGQGRADHRSLNAAVEMAALIARNRRKNGSLL
jgi:4-hydroxythreonine-4-phosphate dehydrogenase